MRNILIFLVFASFFLLGQNSLAKYHATEKTFTPSSTAAVAATIYYIRPTGSNTNNGTSPSTAWKDLTNLANINLMAGNIVYIEAGFTYPGKIYLNHVSGGSSANPVIITSWSANGATTSRATINSGSDFGFYGYNSAGIKISNINFFGNNAIGKDGISFYCDLANNVKKDYIYLENIEVKGYKNGISIGSWNESSGFSNITLKNISSHDNLEAGISTYGQNLKSISNVNLSYCKTYNNLGNFNNINTNTGNGIVLGHVDGGNINHCISYNNGQNNAHLGGGPVGIWCYASNNVIIEHNESYGNKAGKDADGGGFDIDGGSTNCIIQYNYSHDNEGPGYLLAQYSGAATMSNNIIRYNISENDSRKNAYGAITIWAASGMTMSNSQIYNNTIYVTPSTSGTPSGVYIIGGTITTNTSINNNVIQTTGGLRLINAVSTSGINFKGNGYWSTGGIFSINWSGANYNSLSAFRATGQESGAGIQTDPLLTSPGSGITLGNPDNLSTLSGYKLQTSSLMIDAGVVITNPGTRDFYGGIIPQNSKFDIGAHELIVEQVINYRTPENPANTINGLDYKYYEGTWSVLPNFDNITPVKSGTVTTFDLTPKAINDNFGFRYTGFINVSTDGIYNFYTSSDDGSKLLIGTTEIVNNDGLHAAQEKTGSIGLKAGKHAITVLFFDATGGQALTVSYDGPGVTKQAIPASALYRKNVIEPAGLIAGPNVVCANQTGVSYSISTVTGATGYNWTLPTGASISSGANSNSITVNFGSTSGNVAVTPINGSTSGTSSNLSVSVTSIGAAGAITGPTVVGVNENNVTYSISQVAGATSYTWTLPAGCTFKSGEGTTKISVNFGSQGGSVQVTPINSCGNGKSSSLNVSIGTVTEISDGFHSGVTFYPNPAQNHFILKFDHWQSPNAHINIIDSYGELRSSYDLSLLKNDNNEIEVDAGEFISGVYTIEIKTDAGLWHKKIVIAK